MAKITTHKVCVKIEAPHDPDDTKSYGRTTAFSFDMESALPLAELQYIVQQMANALVVAARPQPPGDKYRSSGEA